MAPTGVPGVGTLGGTSCGVIICPLDPEGPGRDINPVIDSFLI